VDVAEPSSRYGGYGQSRFETSDPFASTYSTPGWQRAQKLKSGGSGQGREAGRWGSDRADFDQDPDRNAADRPFQAKERGRFGEREQQGGAGFGERQQSRWSDDSSNVRRSAGPTRDRWGNVMHENRGRVIEGTVVSRQITAPKSEFSVGQRVFHDKFGNGSVTEVDGDKLRVDFDRAGQKTVKDSYVKAI
jgi:DNA helicase-2/ATP-dependent DNA helicase PcrA